MVGPDPLGNEADAWAVLGLKPGASAAERKRAFRQQARRWHPDLNPGDPTAEERFKSINAAYAVLSDPSRQQAWRQEEELSGFPSFEDYLAHLFGRQPPVERSSPPPPQSPSQPPQPPPPPDRPTAREAASTASRPTTPPAAAASQGHPPSRETGLALTPQQAREGSRRLVTLPGGTQVEVDTPPGAGDGWLLRLSGAAPDGGDHLLRLQVCTPDGLRLNGLDVHCRLDVSPADAALGAQVVAPSLHGPVELEIPPRCSSGQLLRLRRCGFCTDEDCGDQIVELRIVIPSHLPEAAVDLYRQLQDLEASF